MLTIGVNSSSVFASSVKKIPIIGKIAEVVYFNKGIEEAIDNEYGQKTDIVCEGKNYDLYVDYVMCGESGVCQIIEIGTPPIGGIIPLNIFKNGSVTERIQLKGCCCQSIDGIQVKNILRINNM